MDRRPLVAVTMGDAVGIGPEVVAKALHQPQAYRVARPVVVGEREVLARAIGLTGGHLEIRNVAHPSEGSYRCGTADLWQVDSLRAADLPWGKVHPEAGRAGYLAMKEAIALAVNGQVEAIATAPLNKQALRSAGVPYDDHTAMLRELTGCAEVLTMFSLGRLKIFFMARHMSLADSIREVTVEHLLRTLSAAQAAMRAFGWSRPTFAVAALNPHAGESGLFGREEIEIIRPAVEQAKALGLDVVGPVPADVVFHQARQGRYDAVLSLYHDQGHIAAKTLDFYRTIALTVGLPFVRTSVDHGTAYDIAGRGVANAVSMLEAIKVAARYVRLRRRAAAGPRR